MGESGCRKGEPMSFRAEPHRRAASAAVGCARAVTRAVLHPQATRLRAERGMAALLLAARGGARYAVSYTHLTLPTICSV